MEIDKKLYDDLEKKYKVLEDKVKELEARRENFKHKLEESKKGLLSKRIFYNESVHFDKADVFKIFDDLLQGFK